MLTYWLLLPFLLTLSLPLRGAVADEADETLAEPRNFNDDATSLQHLQEDGYPDIDVVRRYECPAGFFRLRRYCYYLSGGTAPWREAHFQCTARNATLAVLNRNGKDKILRKYLMGDQFRRLERWIGGIYNWRQMNWEWGVSGEKVLFENFGSEDSNSTKNYMWHCLVLDSAQQYKWSARSCVESKYFICEVPAGRVGKSRRRKNITDPLAPQNQRLRSSTSRDNEYKHKVELSKRKHKNKLKSMRKKNWQQFREDNQVWAHGIKPGSRPPKGPTRAALRRPKLGKDKHSKGGSRHGHKYGLEPSRIAQVTPLENEVFAADGRSAKQHQYQSLSHDEVVFPPLFGAGSDFTREEVLLKL